MGDYTIAKGDCLWNIAQKTYGNQLKSNADIQKAVDTIANENRLSNPDLIYAGNTLILPDANSIFGIDNKTETTENENIFDKLIKWEDSHAENIGDLADGKIDENTYKLTQEEIGLDFDFMEGKDVNDSEAYDAQLLKLGEGEVKAKDSNNDEKVDYKEYFLQEFEPNIAIFKEKIANGEMSENEVLELSSDAFIQSVGLFHIIDEHMGNGDNYLDEKEFQEYYKHLDEFTIGDGTTNRDGSFNIDQISDYPEFLLNQISTLDDIDKTTVKSYIQVLLAS